MNQLVNNLPKTHKIMLISLLACILFIFLVPSEKANAYKSDANDNNLEIGRSYPVTISLEAVEESTYTVPQQQSLRWQTVQVNAGDNLALIFKRAGFSAQTLLKITDIGKSSKALTNIHPGEKISFGRNEQDQLQELHYPINEVSTLIVSLTDDGKYRAETLTKEVEYRTRFGNAEIKSNFWNAGVDAGLTDGQIMNLANIFGWDIDFAMDIRDGDQFSVLFEEKFIDGEYIGRGNIIAAEFVNQGETFNAVRYKDDEYYTGEGRSMRKAFLRAPVNFKYVSSNFNKRRFHPVLKRVKPHNGVDYAARSGTPVYAAGNGKVVRSSYDKYNGNHVFIQHGNDIVTKYLHFSKRAVKEGERVKQGQVIGYVGSTGLSSAPHLHYEFIVNNVHRNPRTVALPKALPINAKEKSAFLQVAKAALGTLDSRKRVLLAANGYEHTNSQNPLSTGIMVGLDPVH